MSVTLMLSAPLITWLLVSTTPDESSTIPVPAACTFGWLSCVLMSTRPGSTLAASAGRSSNTPGILDERGGRGRACGIRGGAETGLVADPLAAGGAHDGEVVGRAAGSGGGDDGDDSDDSDDSDEGDKGAVACRAARLAPIATNASSAARSRTVHRRCRCRITAVTLPGARELQKSDSRPADRDEPH